MLSRATASDNEPTPGYLYGEISRMTLISYEACKEVEDFLLGRLKRNQHNVKLKVLRTIKHVCRQGRTDFRRDMQRQAEAIRACLQYRGPPDPYRGEEIYRLVHAAAKEALEA
ncbi:ccaat-box dna binding protein subunit b, partial [Nannochloropsis gaditana CCMP526]|uniref:ccaat-box dna binding protein subunit b n=1 Tax=Nannochloropsis gaditana (strain CCMP526) TaxID=1093141 RepID=UPI00029F4FBD